MNYIEVHPVTVRGHEYGVKVDSHGWFHAQHNSSDITSETREGLFRKLSELSRKAALKISVPITLLPQVRGSAERAFIKGRHGGNGNILVLNEASGRTEQWTRPGGIITCRDMTRGEIETAYKLRADHNEASTAWENFLQRVRIDLASQADKAIADALAVAWLEEKEKEGRPETAASDD